MDGVGDVSHDLKGNYNAFQRAGLPLHARDAEDSAL